MFFCGATSLLVSLADPYHITLLGDVWYSTVEQFVLTPHRFCGVLIDCDTSVV